MPGPVCSGEIHLIELESSHDQGNYRQVPGI
jgi:hypothetical protein